MKMKKNEAKIYIERIAINKHMMNDFHWDGDTFTDGEVEYQVRDYLNGDFRSILVRFCDEDIIYREFFIYQYEENLSDLFYDALSYNILDEMVEKINSRKRKNSKQLKGEKNDVWLL